MSQHWHEKTVEETASYFKTNLVFGLTEAQAKRELKKIGFNLINKQRVSSPFSIFLQQFNSLVIWVLLTAVVVSFLLDDTLDAVAILAIVILNALIGFILEYRADRAVLALQQIAAPQATVLRDGNAKRIPASDIVPGDILLFESGDVIAADARLFELSSLKTNEASLTGESLPVEKTIQTVSSNSLPAERRNMVFMGTSIVDGTGRAIAVATGMRTEMGHIASMLGEAASHEETPLERKLNQVGSRLLWLCFAIVIVIFFLGFVRNISFFTLFISSVSLAVAAIPEGLPAVVTVSLALGVQRMVRRSVLVRRLSTVETLGCVQVICTDKTGTLTVGEMTARKLITAEDIYTIQGEESRLKDVFTRPKSNISVEDEIIETNLRAMVLCNNAELSLQKNQSVGDPTELALLVAAAKEGFRKDELHSVFPRVKELPFNPKRKRMTVVCEENEQLLVIMKGAPEIILDRCTRVLTRRGIQNITSTDRARIQQSCKMMANEALRVLAFAQRYIKTSDLENHTEFENNMIFLGLVGLQDPPHARAKESVQRCKTAGIKPVMITGDHPDTARAIAQELGIFTPGDRLLTGQELEKMSELEFLKSVTNISVYARVTAEHKLNIVRTWKKHHQVVAMTGDGVNDAPALEEASVGIAMGKTGTSVTKEAADIIILDNDFSSIVAGIEEGRTIYDNIVKTLGYLLAGNMGELLVVFVALLIGWPLPLLPIQLLWVNLVTDGLPAIGLATDLSEPGILNRPPRSSQISLMDLLFFKKVIFIGCLTALVSLMVFAYKYWGTGTLSQAQDAAFSVLVTAELLRAFGARSDSKTIWQLGLFSNLRLFFIISFSFSLQIMIHNVSMLADILGVEPISFKDCLLWVGFGMLPLIVLESKKLITQRKINKVREL